MKTDPKAVVAREIVRDEIIQRAIDAVNKIILKGSGSSTEEIHYLTAQVAHKLMDITISQFRATLLTMDLDIGVVRSVVIKGDIDTKKLCPPGKEYCFECGHIDDPEVFLEKLKCPNPECPNPSGWDD